MKVVLETAEKLHFTKLKNNALHFQWERFKSII